MTEILNGIKTVLQFLNEYWTWIIILAGLSLALADKVKTFINKSTEEKIEIAKEQINQIVLKLVSDAEEEYDSIEKAGSIKRSQVIEKIYAQFPILSKITSQEEIVEFIDGAIDTALETLREIQLVNNDTQSVNNSETKDGE